MLVQWVKDRWAERTSWDGVMLVGVGLVALLFSRSDLLNVCI